MARAALIAAAVAGAVAGAASSYALVELFPDTSIVDDLEDRLAIAEALISEAEEDTKRLKEEQEQLDSRVTELEVRQDGQR